MARPSGVSELPRMIQGGAVRFFKAKHEDGMPMSDIWAELWEADKFKTMDLVMKIIPKELIVDVSGEIKLDTSGFNPEQLKEVFSVDEPTALPGTARDAVEVQGSDPVETPSRATVRSIPQPG